MDYLAPSCGNRWKKLELEYGNNHSSLFSLGGMAFSIDQI
jgi:hypothetical protein